MASSEDDTVKVDEAETLILSIQDTEDYFEILGIERTAQGAEVKRAYRRLALKLHPDKCSHNGAEEAFKKVAAAFACLREDEGREHYLRTGRAVGEQGSNGFQNVDPHDLFREMFAAMQQQQQAQGGVPGSVQFQGGMPPGFTTFSFGGMNGATFSSAQAGGGARVMSAKDLPAWAQTLISVVPPTLIVPLFFMAIIFFFSYAASIILPRLMYFVVIAYTVPPPLRGFLLVLTLLAAVFGYI